MGQETWIIPINPKYFDIQKHLEKMKEIAIKKVRPVKSGDLVYLYIAAPFSQIKYSGIVVKEKCTEEDLKNHEYVKEIKKRDSNIYYMIEVTGSFPDGKFPYSELKENDIGQVQATARASRRLKKYLEENK